MTPMHVWLVVFALVATLALVELVRGSLRSGDTARIAMTFLMFFCDFGFGYCFAVLRSA